MTEMTRKWAVGKQDGGTYEVTVPTGHSRWDFSESQALSVAQMCEEAYQMGRADKARDIKSALECIHDRT